MSGNPDYDGDGWDWPDDEPDDDFCPSCGAGVDHHLGCPDDPDPDYEAEQEILQAEHNAAAET